MNDKLTNLDSICAKHGYEIVKGITDAKALENLITKSLGVLQENGVYAFYLYLAYRSKETGSSEIKDHSLNLLRCEKVKLTTKKDDCFEEIRELTNYLDKLLFARQLLDQMLIYARYHAKALNAKTGESE